MRKYFRNYRSNNQYYVAMKKHTARLLHREGKTLKQIARAICMKERIIKYLLTKQDEEWYEEFIEMNYDRMINNFTYPISVRKGKKRDTTWKELSLESIIQTKQIEDGIQSTQDAAMKL